jgi:heptosyltransferase-3
VKNLDLRKEPVKRILLIRLRNIGDVLLLVPTLRAFREAYPRAYLAAVVNAGTEEMLSGNPLLDEILVFDPHWKALPLRQRVAREGKFVWEVRKRKFDLTINMTEGDRGAFLCLASGARWKVGLNDPRGLWWKRWVYDHWVHLPDRKAHTVEQMLEIPRSLGLNPQDKRVDIFYPPEDREIIDGLLEKGGVGPADSVVHIHPTSRWLFKCWRDEGMAAVIDALQESGKARVVLTSGKEEKELKKIGCILKFCRTQPVNLAGKVTLKQLAALSQRSRLFLGVDTAPMHIAAAVGTPVIALFGPSGEFNWGPWGNGHVVIKKDWECRPCGKDGCQGSKRSRCLEEISEEEVIKEVFSLLAVLEKSPDRGLPDG